LRRCRRAVPKQGLVGGGFEFAAGQHSLGGFDHRGVGGEQHGLRLGVRGFRCLRVYGQDGQQSGFNSGKRRERQLSLHVAHYFTVAGGRGK